MLRFCFRFPSLITTLSDYFQYSPLLEKWGWDTRVCKKCRNNPPTLVFCSLLLFHPPPETNADQHLIRGYRTQPVQSDQAPDEQMKQPLGARPHSSVFSGPTGTRSGRRRGSWGHLWEKKERWAVGKKYNIIYLACLLFTCSWRADSFGNKKVETNPRRTNFRFQWNLTSAAIICEKGKLWYISPQ